MMFSDMDKWTNENKKEMAAADELTSLRSQLSALTEERDTLKSRLAAIAEEGTAELNAAVELRQKLSATAEERDRYREAAARLRYALEKWRHERPFYILSELNQMADAALSLSPLPEREAEREVIAAAEEWEVFATENDCDDFTDYQTDDPSDKLISAVRKLRSLREKG